MMEKLFSDSLNCIDSCIDIYKDFAANEIKNQPPSIQLAWKAGKSIYEYMENKK